jgi:hypothetical protein
MVKNPPDKFVDRHEAGVDGKDILGRPSLAKAFVPNPTCGNLNGIVFPNSSVVQFAESMGTSSHPRNRRMAAVDKRPFWANKSMPILNQGE